VTEQRSDSDNEFGRIPRPPRTTPPIIDRRVLPSGEVEEWERNPTIPDDFIYDPEEHAYYPPGEPVTWDIEADMREFEEARRRGDFRDGDLVAAEMKLRAAGALRKPGKRHKSSGVKSPSAKPQRQLDLFGEEETPGENQTASDAEDAESSD
jgi:hypothetical protein